MPGHAGGVGVDREGPEAEAERLLVGMGQLLIAEIDHLVPEQGGADLLELLVADGGDVDAGDLGAHGGRQGPHLDEVAGLGGVVELVGGMQPHGGCPRLRGRFYPSAAGREKGLCEAPR